METDDILRIDNLSTNKDIGLFTINNECHTLGSVIQRQLLFIKHVKMGTYHIPHPQENVLVIRIETDGEISPQQAFKIALKKAMTNIAIFERKFTKAMEVAESRMETDE